MGALAIAAVLLACAKRNVAAFTNESLMDVDAVILIARWSTYGFGDITGELRHIGLNYDVAADAQKSYSVFREQYVATLQRIASLNIPVIVVHQAPLQQIDAIAILQHAAVFGYDEEELSEAFSIDLKLHSERYGELQAELQGAIGKVAGARIEFVDLAPMLCDPVCQIIRGGRSVYYDDDHLSNFGAERVFPGLRHSLERLIPR